MSRITIIGAGPGGYETAVEAARRGFEVTIVSDGPVGGTCLNEGCIPTKSFCRNAELLEELAKAGNFGLSGLTYSFDFSKVRERKDAVVTQLRSGVEYLLSGKNITLLRGRGRIRDAHTVLVDILGQDTVEVGCDYIIIATGSVPASLPVPGADLPGVLDSGGLLDIDHVPGRLVVIGGGVIGLEFASIFRSFGSEVTVVEFCKEILPRFDSDLAKRLRQSLSKRGIGFETSAAVKSIRTEGEGLMVEYSKKEQVHEIAADTVLMAVGRRPATGSLNLDEAGIEFSAKGVAVDADMRTNVPGIYAIGDITGGYMLAHVATYQGLVALDAICRDCGLPESGLNINLGIVPAAVFTLPEAATVGRTEDECKQEGIAVRCLKSFYRANGKAVAQDETEGMCKIVVEKESGRLLGCHLFGAHASDLVQELAALLTKGASLSDLQSVIHAHPSLVELIQSAAHSA